MSFKTILLYRPHEVSPFSSARLQHSICRDTVIDGFQSRDKAAMLVHKAVANLAPVLQNNRVKYPRDFFLFCSVHQQMRR